MKLLFFTDKHIRGKTPKNRMDNFPETIERKLNEIKQIIKEYNIDYVLHGGDLFDRPDVSISIASNFSKILNSFGVPIYIIVGNHDVYGHNPDTVNRSILGLLDALNVVRLINRDEVIYLNKGGIKVQLTGQPFVYNIDHEGCRSNYIVEEVSRDVDYSIHMVHGMLLNRPFIEGIPYTLIDDIKSTKADITLCGHYHTGFGVINVDGKYFVNPGSLVRITNSLSEIYRMPKVAIITLDSSIDIQLVELKSALKGEEVLNRDEIDNYKFKNEVLFEFKQEIESSIDFDKLKIEEILIEVSNAEGVSEEIRKEALKRIADTQFRMKNSGDEL